MCRAHRPAASALSELDIGTDEPSEPPDPVGGWPGQPKPGQAPHKGRDGPLPGATVPRTGVSAASRGVPYRHCRSTLDVLPPACTTTAAEGHVAPGRDGADARATGPSGSALFTKCWGRWDDSARIIGVA